MLHPSQEPTLFKRQKNVSPSPICHLVTLGYTNTPERADPPVIRLISGKNHHKKRFQLLINGYIISDQQSQTGLSTKPYGTFKLCIDDQTSDSTLALRARTSFLQISLPNDWDVNIRYGFEMGVFITHSYRMTV